MSQKESSKNLSDFTKTPEYAEHVKPLIDGLPECLRGEVEGAMTDGEPGRLLLVLKNLQNQLSSLVGAFENGKTDDDGKA